jgi:hypothetical protein
VVQRSEGGKLKRDRGRVTIDSSEDLPAKYLIAIASSHIAVVAVVFSILFASEGRSVREGYSSREKLGIWDNRHEQVVKSSEWSSQCPLHLSHEPSHSRSSRKFKVDMSFDVLTAI